MCSWKWEGAVPRWELTARGRAPQLAAFYTGTCQHRAVLSLEGCDHDEMIGRWADGRTDHVIMVPFKLRDRLHLYLTRLLQAAHWPDNRCVVLGGGHNVLAVRADRHRRHAVLVTFERQLPQGLRIRNAPDTSLIGWIQDHEKTCGNQV